MCLFLDKKLHKILFCSFQKVSFLFLKKKGSERFVFYLFCSMRIKLFWYYFTINNMFSKKSLFLHVFIFLFISCLLVFFLLSFLNKKTKIKECLKETSCKRKLKNTACVLCLFLTPSPKRLYPKKPFSFGVQLPYIPKKDYSILFTLYPEKLR